MARPAQFNDMELKNFSGLDLRGPGELLTDRSLATLINMEVGDLGQLRTRPGYRQTHSGSTLGAFPVKMLGQYSTTSANSILVQTLEQTNTPHYTGKVYVSTDSGVTWTQISTPAGTLYACGRGIHYSDVTNTAMNIQTHLGMFSYGGSGTWTAVASTLNSSYNPMFIQDRMFLIENSTKNIRWSEVGNAASWPASNYLAFAGGNKDSIVGIQTYRERIVIFFTNHIRILYLNGPPTSWTLKFFPYYMGVQSQECYYVYNDLIYFLSYDGFFRTDLTQIEELSKPIASVFTQRYPAWQYISGIWPRYGGDSIGYWNGKFYISMRQMISAAIPVYRIFSYTVKTGAWAEIIPSISNDQGLPWTPIYSFMPVFVGRKDSGTHTQEGLYFTLCDNTGRIYFLDDSINAQYYDGPSLTYNSIVKTKDIDADIPSEFKRSHTVSIRLKKTNTTTVQTKLNVNGTDLTPVNITPSTTPKQVRIKGPGYFRKMSLEISDNTNQYVEIEGITVGIKRKQGLPETST